MPVEALCEEKRNVSPFSRVCVWSKMESNLTLF